MNGRSQCAVAASLVTLAMFWSGPARADEPLPLARPVESPPARLSLFADPVSDGAVLVVAGGTAIVSELILTTGEIIPQQPRSTTRLLSIDRPVLDQAPKPVWNTVSAVTLYSAVGFAVLDPIATKFRTSTQAAIVDAVIYAESIAITWAMTNLSKIAFRRPRPTAYREQRRRQAASDPDTPPADITQTDSALSFYSGHASITAAVGATASYLAFSRSPGTARPWITLGAGALAATLVDIGRVRAGVHFPTDVIAGTTVGIGIGILVPHLHRAEDIKRRPIWIGVEPTPGGSSLTVSGLL